ncbi:MAG: hypothetical protein ACI9OJ_004776, partial [Myxococcota bacterium]
MAQFIRSQRSFGTDWARSTFLLAALALAGCGEESTSSDGDPDVTIQTDITVISDTADAVGGDTVEPVDVDTDTTTPDTGPSDTGSPDGMVPDTQPPIDIHSPALNLEFCSSDGDETLCGDPVEIDLGENPPGTKLSRWIHVKNLGADALELTAIDGASGVGFVTIWPVDSSVPTSAPASLGIGETVSLNLQLRVDLAPATYAETIEVTITSPTGVATRTLKLDFTVTECSTGFESCDGDWGTGCETDIHTQKPDCGGCGNECVVDNGKTECVGGFCVVNGCKGGFYGQNCDPCPGTSEGSTCSKNGQCNDGPFGDGQCVCTASWTGTSCGVDLDEC